MRSLFGRSGQGSDEAGARSERKTAPHAVVRSGPLVQSGLTEVVDDDLVQSVRRGDAPVRTGATEVVDDALIAAVRGGKNPGRKLPPPKRKVKRSAKSRGLPSVIAPDETPIRTGETKVVEDDVIQAIRSGAAQGPQPEAGPVRTGTTHVVPDDLIAAIREATPPEPNKAPAARRGRPQRVNTAKLPVPNRSEAKRQADVEARSSEPPAPVDGPARTGHTEVMDPDTIDDIRRQQVPVRTGGTQVVPDELIRAARKVGLAQRLVARRGGPGTPAAASGDDEITVKKPRPKARPKVSPSRTEPLPVVGEINSEE